MHALAALFDSSHLLSTFGRKTHCVIDTHMYLSTSLQPHLQHGLCLSLVSAGRNQTTSVLQNPPQLPPVHLPLAASVSPVKCGCCLPQPTPGGKTRGVYGLKGAKRLVRIRMRGLRDASVLEVLELPPSKSTVGKCSVLVKHNMQSLEVRK